MLSENIQHIIQEATKESMLRQNIKIGSTVDIVLKKDQKTGILTRGKVSRLLTNKGRHTRGIKVQLEDGQVGRVQVIVK